MELKPKHKIFIGVNAGGVVLPVIPPNLSGKPGVVGSCKSFDSEEKRFDQLLTWDCDLSVIELLQKATANSVSYDTNNITFDFEPIKIY